MSYSGRRLRADPFTDLLFNVLLSFTLLMFLAIIFMKSMNTAFRHAVKTSWNQRDESYRRFKEIILKHCKYSHVSLKDAHMMTDFATRTLFRVFHLFRNAFV